MKGWRECGIIPTINHQCSRQWDTSAESTCTYRYLWHQALLRPCFGEGQEACGLSAHVEVGGCSTLLLGMPRQCRTDPRLRASHPLLPPQTVLSATRLHSFVHSIETFPSQEYIKARYVQPAVQARLADTSLYHLTIVTILSMLMHSNWNANRCIAVDQLQGT